MDQILESLRKQEQDILDVFHEVCVKNHLKYSLAYGTMLGSVRHKGFIPWDDDIDIFMPRKDYEKLLKIWNRNAPKDYILLNKRSDPFFDQNFSKIRKNHTCFLQFESELSAQYHKGIFIDIFPGERLSRYLIIRLYQYTVISINIIISRLFSIREKGILSLFTKVFSRVPIGISSMIYNLSESLVIESSKRADGDFIFPNTFSNLKRKYPGDMFDNMQLDVFNNKKYYCMSDKDYALKLEYGNYMKLPPEKDRVWKHHPIIIDFEHNYEEL